MSTFLEFLDIAEAEQKERQALIADQRAKRNAQNKANAKMVAKVTIPAVIVLVLTLGSVFAWNKWEKEQVRAEAAARLTEAQRLAATPISIPEKPFNPEFRYSYPAYFDREFDKSRADIEHKKSGNGRGYITSRTTTRSVNLAIRSHINEDDAFWVRRPDGSTVICSTNVHVAENFVFVPYESGDGMCHPAEIVENWFMLDLK